MRALTFCYCLTTNGADAHAASTLVSVLSLRRQHDQSRILLLADDESARCLERHRHPLLTLVDELVSVPVPVSAAGMRNRHVKTRMPQIVEGDFLYLDGDTVVVRPLDEVFQIDAPFAAARNHNSSRLVEPEFAVELNTFKRLGWDPPGTPYVNGGVLFFRDDPAVRRFSELWHRKWLQASASGKHYDQSSLNSALWDSRIESRLLPHRFNAQIHVRPRTALGAHLWHIYASASRQRLPRTGLDSLVRDFLSTGTPDPSAVARFCARPHPWLVKTPLDAIIIRMMLKRWDYLSEDSFECQWLSDRRRAALKGIVPAVGTRLARLLHAIRPSP